ncbi:MAG: reverse transcriptase family protein [Pirellula sp.]|jgi:hypothetical protein|nr:reverse transcriptase family protein [Pirellula sp.]
MNAPPLLVSFRSLERLLYALDAETRESYEDSIKNLYQQNRPIVVSTKVLGVLFGLRPQFISTMRRRPHRYYNRFEIRKGNKKRLIQAPRVSLKIIQKWFGHHFGSSIELPDCVVGFVPGRSAVEGASRHCGADWLFSTDIENFFQSTSQNAVVCSLIRFGYSHEAASLIADLNCINGALAQGSPASPVLANISLWEVDERLNQIAIEHNAIFTRYADDVVFSGRGTRPERLREQVEKVFVSTCWSLAAHKTRFSSRPQRLKVYGLLVHGATPQLTKGYRKRIRAIKHQLKNGTIPVDKQASAEGHLSYAKQIEGFSRTK